MALKPNTLKLLLLLYEPDPDQLLFRPQDQVLAFLHELTPAGQRSLVSHLNRQGLIEKEELEGLKQLRLSRLGRKQVEAHFPAFSPERDEWSGKWSLIIFLTPPKGDAQFRYLRSQLTSRGIASLTRGVYLYPGIPEPVLLDELETRYAQSVVVTTIENWVIGDKRSLIVNAYELSDVGKILSGISSDVKRMLKDRKSFATLNDQQKKHLFSVFDRFYDFLSTDPGITGKVFPQYPSVIEIWKTFQKALSN